MQNTIQLKALPGNRFLSKNATPEALYLYVELKAREAVRKKERLPLNISLVIDRSGSMQGEKIANVKKAVKFVIDNLTAEDYLSIIIYDSRIDVVSPSQFVRDKQQLHQLVDRIFARNMTNLSGGLLEGYKQVMSTKKEGYVNRVLLLTDGLANQGITDFEQLQAIAQKKFREHGIALSTFGVGADFNEQLLTNLAEYGGANYYFIDSPEKIPEIFAKELEGLLAVVAQNTQIEINYPAGQVKVDSVLGYPAQIRDGKAIVPFNDLHSLEEKAVLIVFRAKDIGADLIYQIELRYDDVLEVMDTVEEVQTVTVERTANEAEVQTGADPVAQENIVLFLASDYYEQAVSVSERRNYEGAKMLVHKAMAILELHDNTFGFSPRLRELYDRIRNFATMIDRMEEMTHAERSLSVKASRMMAYSFKKKRDTSVY